MHHVLYILYDGLTDPLGQSQVLPYLKGLTRFGYRFTIISCDKRDRFVQFEEAVRTSIADFTIAWHPLVYHKSPPVLSTLYDIRNITRKAYQLNAEASFDAVHCRSYIPALVGLWMKQQFGTRFIFDMRGFWADERIDGRIWNLSNPLYKLIYNYFKKKELEFLTHADYTISLTNSARDIIHRWDSVNGQPIPIRVIPCCVDTERFSEECIDPDLQESFKVKHAISDDEFILSYLGSIGTWYMLDEMLDYFKELLGKRSNARFLFLTNEDPAMIHSAAAGKQIPQDRLIIDRAAFTDVPSLISVSNVSIFFIKPVFSKKASSPVKHAELMSLGIPVICNSDVGDLDGIVEATGTGTFVEDFTREAYERSVDGLDQVATIDPRKIREEAIRIYGLDHGIQNYLHVYRSLMENEAVPSS